MTFCHWPISCSEEHNHTESNEQSLARGREALITLTSPSCRVCKNWREDPHAEWCPIPYAERRVAEMLNVERARYLTLALGLRVPDEKLAIALHRERSAHEETKRALQDAVDRHYARETASAQERGALIAALNEERASHEETKRALTACREGHADTAYHDLDLQRRYDALREMTDWAMQTVHRAHHDGPIASCPKNTCDGLRRVLAEEPLK